MNHLMIGTSSQQQQQQHRRVTSPSSSTTSGGGSLSPPTTLELHQEEDSFAKLDQDQDDEKNYNSYSNGGMTENDHHHHHHFNIHTNNHEYSEEMMDIGTITNLNLQHRKGYTTQEEDMDAATMMMTTHHEAPILRMNEGSTTSSLNDDTTPTPLTTMASLSHIPSTAQLLSKQSNVGGKLYNSARTLLQKKYSAELEKKQLSTKKHTHYIYTYLTLLGFLGGLISFSHDIIVRYLVLGKNSLINLWDPEKDYSLRMFIWIVYNLSFVSFAIVLTALFAPAAEGSGLAGIKAILNGVRGLKDVLSLKTMIVKLLCLPAVLTAGLYVGKMGPSMHISMYLFF